MPIPENFGAQLRFVYTKLYCLFSRHEQVMQFALELTRHEIEVGTGRRFAMPFEPNFTALKTSKHRNFMAPSWTTFSSSGRVNSNAICFRLHGVMICNRDTESQANIPKLQGHISGRYGSQKWCLVCQEPRKPMETICSCKLVNSYLFCTCPTF